MEIQERQLQAAQSAAGVLRRFLDESQLSMGGGTVLQCDWMHRLSTDVDLFCPPDMFAEAVRIHGGAIERSLVKTAGAAKERTWMDPIALYAEIGGVETTVLPCAPLTGSPVTSRKVPGTMMAVQSTAEILAKKILHRLYEAEVAEVRDLYDIAVAQRLAPQALQAARSVLPSRALAAVSAMVRSLPDGWSRTTNKMVLAARFSWTEGELAQKAALALFDGRAELDAGREPGLSGTEP